MILFVTGTDTDVGKTIVGAALLASAREKGRPVRGIKPVESGCLERDGKRVAADANILARAAGHEPDVLYTYEAPLAPAVAASEADEPAADIERCVRHIQDTHDRLGHDSLVIVEGAGGLLVPLAGNHLIADFAHRLGAPILVVGRDGLGTINHMATTIECARHRQLEVLGFVFSATGEVPASRANANARSVEQITEARYGGTLPRLGDLEVTTLAAAGGNLVLSRQLQKHTTTTTR